MSSAGTNRSVTPLRLRGGGCAPSKAYVEQHGQPVQAQEQATPEQAALAAERVAEHVAKVEKRLAARLATLDKERGLAAVASSAQVEVTAAPSPKPKAQVVLASNLKLKPEQEKLIELIFDGCLKVDVTPLHGGLSGSLVLRTDSTDADGRQEEPTVLKLDTREVMQEEVKQTMLIARQAGEGVIEIRREPMYVGDHGAVLLEMAVACWVVPEFYNSASEATDLISTLKRKVTAQLVAAGVKDCSLLTGFSASATRLLTSEGGQVGHLDVGTESLVATLRELWSVGSPLSNLALKTAKREAVRACDAKGRVSTWLRALMERVVVLFLPPEVGSTVPLGYELPSPLTDELRSFGVRLDPSKHAKRFKTSFVHELHELGDDVWGGDKSLPLQELFLLLKKLALPESWLAEWWPLICHVHGDLNFGNILVDARDALWLIDVC